MKALEDENEAVAGRAEDFLLWLGERAAPAVTAAVHHSSAPHSCVWILGQIGGLVALDPLEASARSFERPDPRGGFVGLGKLRDPISLQPLLRATRDSEHIVRVQAADALDRFGTVAVIAALSAPLSPAIREALPNDDTPPAAPSTKSRRRSTRPAQNGSSPRAKNAFPPRPSIERPQRVETARKRSLPWGSYCGRYGSRRASFSRTPQRSHAQK